jgi:hypothetical protein
VLGLWALAQHAPQLAARFFQIAEEGGYPGAKINRAIALTEASGLPYGDNQAAKTAWEEVLTEDSLQGNTTAQTMLKILSYQDFLNIEKEEDTFKYQLLRICGGKLSVADIDLILTHISNINYKAAALLDMSVKYPHLDSTLWNTHPVSLGNDALWPAIKIRLQWRMAEQYAKEAKAQEIIPLVGSLTPESARQKSIALYCQAVLAASEGKEPEAEIYFQRLFDNPFYPTGVEKAADYFTNKEEDDFWIYNKLLKTMEINPYSAILHKQYILQSLKIGLDNYAANAYQELQKLATENEYKRFTKVYEQKLQEKAYF